MTNVIVSSASALQSALSSAQAGETILLAPGNYSGVTIQNLNFSSNVTIASESSASPAVLTGLQVSGSSGLSFSNLDIVGTGQSVWFNAAVSNSSNISFSNMLVEGTGTSPNANAGGMEIMNSSGVSVTNSTFQVLCGAGGLSAIQDFGDTGVTISNNVFTNLGCDGIDTAGTSNVTISGNTFSNFNLTAGEHPDAMQFWTEGSTTSAQNITISDNTYVRGRRLGGARHLHDR